MLSSLTAALCLLVAPAAAQDQEHPIVAEAKASLKDPAKPFTLVVRIKVKEGAGAKFEAAYAKAAAGTRQEKGNRAYDLHRSAKAPNEYLLYERWQDLAALQTHLKAPHFAAFFAEAGSLFDGRPEAQIMVPVE
jgi:quinol monooxygenase YgiN